MTQDWMIKVLNSLGFKEHESRIYAYLAFQGPKKAKELADALKIYRRKIYRALTKLKQRVLWSAQTKLW